MVNTNPSFPQEELKSFKDISFKLGSNSHLVQAAGGNTSIKSDGRMLIKASGTWLINSLDKDIFVEVDLNSITEKINNLGYKCYDTKDFKIGYQSFLKKTKPKFKNK